MGLDDPDGTTLLSSKLNLPINFYQILYQIIGIYRYIYIKSVSTVLCVYVTYNKLRVIQTGDFVQTQGNIFRIYFQKLLIWWPYGPAKGI